MRNNAEEPRSREEILKDLRRFSARLMARTNCPHMREKIAAVMRGERVDH